MATKQTASPKKAAQPNKATEEDRAALNDKARYDYGIMNADQMSDTQLKREMGDIDKQLKVGQAEDKKAAKEAEKSE